MKKLMKIDKHWNIFVGAILTLAAGWIVMTSLFSNDHADQAFALARTGFQAPNFQLSTEDGQRISLVTLQGKPVIVNFWASWCLPCKAEMPALEKIHRRYASQVVVLGVNVAAKDHQPSARRFLKENGITFPVVWDWDDSVAALYRVDALPTTFFIDSYGRITNVIIGGPMPEALLIAEVEKLRVEE